MDGVWVIDKPSGLTSFDVVQRVRKLLRVKKAGHTGTLDPMATGVLPVCVGEATKIAGHILQADKTYEAVIRLGVETDTLDAQGQVVRERPVPPLSAETVEAALARFRGPFLQTPPMYSAIKIDGKRLYESARAGEEVERRPREVTVHALVLRSLAPAELTVAVRCSKGFYVRALAKDVGEALGCGGHLSALRRTQSGPFRIADALPLAELEALSGDPAAVAALAGARRVSMSDALAELPAMTVTAAEAVKVRHGVPLELRGDGADRSVPALRVLGGEGELLAIAAANAGRLTYLRVLSSGD